MLVLVVARLVAVAAELGELGDAVRDVGDDVEPGDALLAEEEGRVRLGLAEHRHQHVPAVDFVLAGRLHVRGGALQHALEGQRLLRHGIAALGERLQLVIEVGDEVALQPVHVAAAAADDVGHPVVVQQREEHVLDAEKLVAAPPGFVDGEGEGRFERTGEMH